MTEKKKHDGMKKHDGKEKAHSWRGDTRVCWYVWVYRELSRGVL